MKNRRTFLKQLSAIGGGAALTTLPAKAMISDALGDNDNLLQGELIRIKTPGLFDHLRPLEMLELEASDGKTVRVYDGDGVQYETLEAEPGMKFTIAGALGNHVAMLFDKKGRVIDLAAFKVDTKTTIEDKGEEFRKMLDMLIYSCRVYAPSYFRMKEKVCMTYAGWFQDHVHVFKAMKYFDQDVKSGFDLWAMGQRENGMLADNCYMPWSGYKSWLTRFGEDFVWTLGDKKTSSTFYIRIPVENMSEFTFLEGIYYAWKATGDDAWMKGKLENCIKAVEYATSDEYRWSEKFQLLKRGYTIDIWDFQPEMDNKKFGGDIMMAKPGITEYSVMYGDNVGMSVGCKYLAEMLEYAGREQEGNPEAGSTGNRSFRYTNVENMSKSCLFFSGAQNTLYFAYDYAPGHADGILTAYEISDMDLKGTELVVLSACETGLGDVLKTEGVTGLRRAFRLAGARRIMLSLWDVDDQATQLIMREFYANWLSGMDMDQSLTEAKRTLRDQTPYSHPRYWAAFILTGI